MDASSDQKNSFTKWMKRNFTQAQMKDIANYGVNNGLPHLTYYMDTTALYKRYHEDIWEMLNDDAGSMGHQHPLEMIATFGGAENAVSRHTFENLIVWYAAEKIARELTEI